MIVTPEPRELSSETVKVSGNTGQKVLFLSGYLDALIINAPANETYKVSIKGPAGIEYWSIPSGQQYQGDNTAIFEQAIPMTGKMTFTIFNTSADGDFIIIPIGNVKGT